VDNHTNRNTASEMKQQAGVILSDPVEVPVDTLGMPPWEHPPYDSKPYHNGILKAGKEKSTNLTLPEWSHSEWKS